MKVKGEIVSICRFFDDVECCWKYQGTIAINFESEPDIKIGACEVHQEWKMI